MSWFEIVAKAVIENGVTSVGIATALDRGVEKKYYTVIPKACYSKLSLTGNFVSSNAESVMDPTNAEIKGDPYEVKGGLVLTQRWNRTITFRHNNVNYARIVVEDMKDIQLAAFFSANMPWIDAAYVAYNWDVKSKPLMFAIVLLTWLEGLIDADEDAEVIFPEADPVPVAIPQGFMEDVKKVYDSARLLCAGAILNHYKINHTTGQGALQGFLAKIAKVINPLEQKMSADKGVMKAQQITLCDWLYLALHRVGKRNGAFALLEPNASVVGAFDYRLRPPIVMKKDDFVSLRTLGAPAGASKVSVVAAAMKLIAKSDLIIFMPEKECIQTLVDLHRMSLHYPLYCHAGARWYAKFHPDVKNNNFDFAQNKDDIVRLTKVTEIFLFHVAKRSTLYAAPQYADLHDAAATEYPIWNKICSEYQAARIKEVVNADLALLLSTDLKVNAVKPVEDAFAALKDPNKANEKDAARDVIRAYSLELVKDL